MKPIKSVICTAAFLGISGCGGGSQTTYTVTKVVPPPVALAGTNGDMSKYLGTWSSNCGTDILAKTSALNTFSFTSVSGASATGTLTTRIFHSLDCSGTEFGVALPQKVTLTYQSNLVVNVTDGLGTVYSGNADKVVLQLQSTLQTSSFNVGFTNEFTKFKLNSNGNFSATDLTYSKFIP